MTDPSNSTPNNSDPNSSNPSSPVPSSPDPSSPDPSFRAPMGDYTKLSRFMGSWPEMSNFRKFGALNAQNLLYLQAELANLEDQLHEIRRRDAMDEKKRQYATSWLELGIKEEGQGSCQYEKAMEIRAKLAEYNATLLQYHELSKLRRPTKHNLQSLRNWLDHKDGGDCFLEGLEADPYEDTRPELEKDLVSMSDVHHQRDLFSWWLGDYFVKWFELRFGHMRKHADIEAGLSHYEDLRLNAISHFVGTMIASLLPAISIFVLYFVHNMLARLGAIMAFSALFSFTLAVFTTAKRIEIFAATAAYVAVFLCLAFVMSPGLVLSDLFHAQLG